MSDPRLTITVTEKLMLQLIEADRAIRRSPKARGLDMSEFRDLAVRVVHARQSVAEKAPASEPLPTGQVPEPPTRSA